MPEQKKDTNQSKNETTAKKKTHPLKTIKTLCRNKYFILITLAFAVIYTSLGLTGGSRIYYAKYVLGDEMLNSTMTMFNYIPTILTIMLIPVFTKRFGKIKALFVGFLFYAAGLVLEIAGPVNLPMIYTGLVLQGIGHAALYSCLFAIVGDVVDYSEWKDGVREEGITYSVTSFGQKIGTGLGTAALGWILAAGHYDGTAAVQSASAIFAIKGLFLYLPLVITVIVLIIWYLFMGIDKIYPTVRKELDERREKAE
mgnify:FL=1